MKRISKNIRYKRRRENLLKQDPHCYWCGVEVVYFEIPRFMTMPDNFATIDHLHTRYFPATRQATVPGKGKGFVVTTVLACHKCNQIRSDKETKRIDREELWKRSGAYPQGHPLNRDLFAKHREIELTR